MLGGSIGTKMESEMHRLPAIGTSGVSLAGVNQRELAAWADRIVCIVGPSGAGKHTLCHQIMRLEPEHFVLLGPTTTRECDSFDFLHNNYQQVTTEECITYLRDGRFLYWHSTPHGVYGLSKERLRSACRSARRLLLTFRSVGAITLKSLMSRITVIELRCGVHVLAKRAVGRSYSRGNDVATRLAAAERELQANETMFQKCIRNQANRWHQISNDDDAPPISPNVVSAAIAAIHTDEVHYYGFRQDRGVSNETD